MERHSQPANAPAAMVALYGTSNGFGWKQGSVIAAQIVFVPMSVPLRMARDEFRTQLIYLSAILLVSLVVLNSRNVSVKGKNSARSPPAPSEATCRASPPLRMAILGRGRHRHLAQKLGSLGLDELGGKTDFTSLTVWERPLPRRGHLAER
jgi:hypothetical protein